MKKIICLSTLALVAAVGLAEAQTLTTYQFTSGPAEVPTFTGGTASQFQRGAGLTSSTATGAFNSAGWTGEATDYNFFTLTASVGNYLMLTTLDFKDQRSGTGPTSGNAQILTSGGTLLETSASYTTAASIAAAPQFDFVNVITDAIQFRFTAAVATATGTLRFDDVAVGGSAAAGTGAIALAASTRLVSDNATLNLSGVVSGAFPIEKLGSGTVTLSGASANTYSGSTSVSTGTLVLGKTAGVNAIAGNVTIGDNTATAGSDILQLNADNQIADTSTITVNGTGTNIGILRLNGNDETVAVLNSSAAGTGAVENNHASAASTFTVSGSAASNFSGVIRNGAAGTLALAKSDSGTLTLSGANTYTGGTTVSTGTLLLSNATTLQSATGTLVVGGGSLSSSVASSTLGGNLTLSTGTLDPNGTGVGAFVLASNKSFLMDGGTWNLDILTPTSFDKITGGGTGTFTINGGVLDLTGSTIAAGSYNILSGFNSGSGSFTDITGFNEGVWLVTFDATTSTGVGILNIVAVPEPHEYGLALGGMLALLVYFRRCRNLRA